VCEREREREREREKEREKRRERKGEREKGREEKREVGITFGDVGMAYEIFDMKVRDSLHAESYGEISS